MSEIKEKVRHTEGPFQIDHDEEAMATYITTKDFPNLACLSWTAFGLSREEIFANARLFAVAPDLLDMVKQVLEYAEDNVDGAPDGKLYPIPASMVDELKEALAKAEPQ